MAAAAAAVTTINNLVVYTYGRRFLCAIVHLALARAELLDEWVEHIEEIQRAKGIRGEEER